MDGINSQISFIPKGSLVHEESFLERSRPRSIIGFIAISVFLIVIGAFIGFYFYNNSLNQIIAQKTIEIKKAQKEFSGAPEVAEAKIFRARADLARELLNAHLVVTPVFEFLSQSTISSIAYNRFNFESTAGVSSLSLSGEAPSYVALAYQIDILQKQTKALAGLYVEQVNLTNFGTISFSIKLVFNPEFLLYTKNLNGQQMGDQASVVPTVSLPVVDSPSINFEASSSSSSPVFADTNIGVIASSSASSSLEMVPTDSFVGLEESAATASSTVVDESASSTSAQTTESVAVQTAKQSFWQLLWLKLKFW